MARELRPQTELLIHTLAVAPDRPGMVDVTFQVPTSEVLGKSLAQMNTPGELYALSGWFTGRAEALLTEEAAARDAAHDGGAG